jgi:hypothetical protein
MPSHVLIQTPEVQGLAAAAAAAPHAAVTLARHQLPLRLLPALVGQEPQAQVHQLAAHPIPQGISFLGRDGGWLLLFCLLLLLLLLRRRRWVIFADIVVVVVLPHLWGCVGGLYGWCAGRRPDDALARFSVFFVRASAMLARGWQGWQSL